ncbi:hypothetical protein [Listeria seeligeri]|uniref:hypothetical protein n=1 Tax=Listeria seeligeri TaxID=1640 RepID=UPI001627DB92|nr:hypothetical protein [Listeria seeligeri]MBC1471952.1 hypothetical protein [Listeria seeligeri]MBC1538910.1 hypothetical protein [Listeria seeligeri]MBC1556230.1 hypothetical protein [Listeria seeligeri]MBC6123142.1 hypothetical protein [Listeria seeligeri]MBF2672793.1 hypothetical protein [Listeria seeligeri]
MNVYIYPRIRKFEKECFYFNFNSSKINKVFLHLLEHLVINRIKKIYQIKDIDGYTTEDFMKINITQTEEMLYEKSIWVKLLSEFTKEEFDFSMNEIHQELLLTNSNLTNLLNDIRNNDTPNGEYLGDNDMFNNSIKKELSKLSLIIFSDNEKIQSIPDVAGKYSSVTNKVNYETISRGGMKSFQRGKYIYLYLNIPIEKVEKNSYIYHLQVFTSYLAHSIQSFRKIGSYYSIAFNQYHKKYIELFVIVSTSELISVEIINSLKRIIATYTIEETKVIETTDDIYRYKEDLCGTYITNDFIQDNVPISDNDVKTFINEQRDLLLECLI